MSRDCRAVVRVGDNGYTCECDAPHPGLAHQVTDVWGDLICWASDGEVKQHGKKETVHG